MTTAVPGRQDVFAAELSRGGAAREQHGQAEAVACADQVLTLDPIVGGRARSGDELDARQPLEFDACVKRIVADRLDIDLRDVVAVDLAPFSQALLGRKRFSRDRDGRKR
ncbi:hypothetical protein [Bradyrhizobium guangdongense]|uniref:Uncharacterized protein n=1 Tax=Bradyrhizobium guangdongense TaxID=1325090 RepID=A0A7S7V4P8_9BRAD|nr:hypothetical protein [Bradyrhizobium guangdongense]QOZ59771.1 hypothetical protein XH86_14310 [Bradyrhizobium guangdongense]